MTKTAGSSPIIDSVFERAIEDRIQARLEDFQDLLGDETVYSRRVTRQQMEEQHGPQREHVRASRHDLTRLYG